MPEYGLFNEEGCIEAGFHTVQEAVAVRSTRYDPEDELRVLEICPDHLDELEPLLYCELCAEEE